MNLRAAPRVLSLTRGVVKQDETDRTRTGGRRELISKIHHNQHRYTLLSYDIDEISDPRWMRCLLLLLLDFDLILGSDFKPVK